MAVSDPVAEARKRRMADSAAKAGQTLDVNAQRRTAQIAATRPAALEAQAAQNLRALDTGQSMQSLNDRVADQVMQQTEPDPETQPRQYMQRLSERIVEMEKQAKEVEKSGTGNQAAADTYRKVAEILRTRLRTLQNKMIGSAPSPTGGR